MNAGTSGSERKSGGIRTQVRRFWAWYERNYKLNITIALALFVLQLFHLTWLSLDVVATRLVGHSLFPAHGLLLGILVVVDLFEIPALISVSLVYINEMRKKPNAKSALFLFLLNSQWLHIFWITDSFVVKQFGGAAGAWPVWLAWVAIGIDYFELPVMLDTTKRFFGALASGACLEEVKASLVEDADDATIKQVDLDSAIADSGLSAT